MSVAAHLPLCTERLVIRGATAEDALAVWRFRQLPSVAEWINRRPTDLNEWRQNFVTPERFADTLVIELDGEVIGDLMLANQDPWAQVEVRDRAVGTQAVLGWVLHPDFEGRGYATEAVRALIGLAFGPLGLRRVSADCFVANEPSWRLMERVGMRREAHNVKDSLHRTKGWLDNFTYALLAEEWSG